MLDRKRRSAARWAARQWGSHAGDRCISALQRSRPQQHSSCRPLAARGERYCPDFLIERRTSLNRTVRLQRHYERVWSRPTEVCPFDAGPVHELPPGFRVLCAAPDAKRVLWTYATAGLSSSKRVPAIELHLFSPRKSLGLVELLYAVAHYHCNGPGLDWAHTVNLGRPWLDSSKCEYGLVSRPYLDGPDLENYSDEEGGVKCYWLVPITADEVRLKVRQGIDSLEDEFERQQFNYADPGRKSVAGASDDEGA